MNNKGQALTTFRGLIISLVVISFVVGIGFMLGSEVNTQVEEQAGVDSVAANGTSEILDAMADIPGWIPLVIIAVIGLVLLALISRYQGTQAV